MMKKTFSFLTAILLTVSVFAQSPKIMSYQAVIRNSNDALVSNANVGMQISILQDSVNGTAVYIETQTPTTNANGLVSIEIGKGEIVSGNFASIDWAKGPYFIKTETDPSGGTSYTISGTSQLLSVPYALYAEKSNSVSQTVVSVTAQNEWINLFPVNIDWGIWTIMARAHGFGFKEKFQEWKFIIGDNVENVYFEETANVGNAVDYAELRIEGGYVQGRWTGLVGGGPFCKFIIQYTPIY